MSIAKSISVSKDSRNSSCMSFNVGSFFSNSLKEYCDEILNLCERSTRIFMRETLNSSLNEISNLYTQENWQIKGDWVGATKLPEIFKSLVQKTLAKLDPVVKLSPVTSSVRNQ
jgi:hypothetical protein